MPVKEVDDWAVEHDIGTGPYAVFIGRLVLDKGLQELMTAWRMVRDKVPGARLVVVGERDPADEIADGVLARLNEDPTIRCVGHQPNVGIALVHATVLVLPSRREGMPTVVLEAAALGVPAVVFDVTGSRDAVVDGVTGHLVPLDNVALLARRIAELLQDPKQAQELGRAAQQFVERAFDPKTVVARYFDELEKAGMASD